MGEMLEAPIYGAMTYKDWNGMAEKEGFEAPFIPC
jgi:hypothetical protein